MATVSDPQSQAPPQAQAQPASAMQAGWTPANPAPLGLYGFGISTAVLSFVNANIIGGGPATYPIVLGLAIAFGGIAQFFAGMWEFRAGNGFGAVAFSSFGAFWLSFFVLVSFNITQLPAHEVNAALGLWLIVWGVFTACLFLCTFASARAIQLLFLLLTATFILLGIGQNGGHTNVVHIGGYVGIATAAVAVYIATAELMKGVYGHSMLPIGEPTPRT
jgi:succinate-acetate transporter protein